MDKVIEELYVQAGKGQLFQAPDDTFGKYMGECGWSLSAGTVQLKLWEAMGIWVQISCLIFLLHVKLWKRTSIVAPGPPLVLLLSA